MKIAVILYELTQISGINKHALMLCKEFVSLGHQVDIYCLDYDKEKCYPELIDSIKVSALRPKHKYFEKYSQKKYRIGFLVYLWNLWNLYSDSLNLNKSIPLGYDIIFPNGNLVSWSAAIYKKHVGTPVLWLCNDFWPQGSFQYENSINIWMKIKQIIKVCVCFPFEQYDQAAIHTIDKVVVLSEHVQKQMKDHYHIDSSIVRPGIDTSKFTYRNIHRIRSRYHISNKSFVILSVCVLMPWRRLEDVIEAVGILIDLGYDINYFIVGRMTSDPNYVQYLQSKVEELSLSNRVIFFGEVPEKDLGSYFHTCNTFMWVSDERQSWGLAGIEAMASGKIIIVSKANGLAEVLTNGKNAIIVPARSPIAIAEAIKQILEVPSLARNISDEGRRFVRTHFSIQNHAKEILTLFEDLINKTASRSGKAQTHIWNST